MPRYDFKAPRLFVSDALAAGARIALDRMQANYLLNVLRLKPGGSVLAFNGRDGEWRGVLAESGRRDAALDLAERTREQTPQPNLVYAFAPLKHARLDYMVQKVVEMGVGRLQPVLTQRSQVARVNGERMRANVIEAAEQCGVIAVPEIGEPLSLKDFVEGFRGALLFCDEEEGAAPLGVLAKVAAERVGVLIGPEGGFSEEERGFLRSLAFVVPIGLGPRILRADTAAVAALALAQATLGDWN